MIDNIRGAESDSGLFLVATCPECGREHKVALTRLDGRFSFQCGDSVLIGQVKDWDRYKGATGPRPTATGEGVVTP